MMIMQALRPLSLCFASVLAFGVVAGAAEARQVEYEINGTTYTYSTGSRVQVELARRRIEAANRVDEIKVRAAAEAASNPFVQLFGSPTQAEVPAAQAELQKVLAEPEPSRAEANAVDRQVRRELRIERRRMAVESRAKKRQQIADRRPSSMPDVGAVRGSRIAALTGSQSQDSVVTTGQVSRSARPNRSEPREPIVASARAPAQPIARPAEVAAEPMDSQADMMGFVEQLRGKTSSDPISRRLREQ